ncbi:MAG: DUF4097 family beta strand repeat protein [Erysipelotrichaceae bacterium]|nr:DUF4097 family beta strand repeat protein [Erysipelotrichaceae bacterium]
MVQPMDVLQSGRYLDDDCEDKYFDFIEISTMNADIILEESENGFRFDFNHDIFVVELESDELRIHQRNKDARNEEVRICLPIGKKNDVEIHTISGNVLVRRFIADYLEVKTVSGDIKVNDCTINELVIKTTSGLTNVYYGDIPFLEIESVTGNAEVRGTDAKHILIHSTCGNLKVGILDEPDRYYTRVITKYSEEIRDRKDSTREVEVYTVSGEARIEFMTGGGK